MSIYAEGDGNFTGEFLSSLSDNESINDNNGTEHSCLNYSPAYYRVYMEHTSDPFMRKKVGFENSLKAARVARTIPVTRQEIETGVDGISVDEITEKDSAPVYYNMQGIRVSRPSKGIYLRVQGGKVTKELFR